ncbi:hypothetical protein CFOL_v3_29017 [Cephalotus follicularis]|uniref:DUF4283 domain-containing protein n=1 Tax=Cephalotus follicularis TaxID=3775 RepID=A0A1Q3CZL7_CEPFO|nr:hypothetical protein CFOL_v3_29017 [Cephalotus follicularis]
MVHPGASVLVDQDPNATTKGELLVKGKQPFHPTVLRAYSLLGGRQETMDLPHNGCEGLTGPKAQRGLGPSIASLKLGLHDGSVCPLASRPSFTKSATNPMVGPYGPSESGEAKEPKQSVNMFSLSMRSESKLSFFPPVLVAGEVIAKPPGGIFKQGAREWNTSLVGHFVGRRIPFKAVNETLHKKWKVVGHFSYLRLRMVSLCLNLIMCKPGTGFLIRDLGRSRGHILP